MKKTLALLAVAAMMFTTGCGGEKNVEDAAKDATNAAVETVKDAAGGVTDAATNALNNATNAMMSLADDATAVVQSIQSGDKTGIALGGIVPGVNLDFASDIYSTPVISEGNMRGFSNGLDVIVDDKNIIQEVSTVYEGIYTPADIEVGMMDYALNGAYGSASSITTNNAGNTVYKYLSKDNRRAIEFITRDGVIIEIRCGANK